MALFLFQSKWESVSLERKCPDDGNFLCTALTRYGADLFNDRREHSLNLEKIEDRVCRVLLIRRSNVIATNKL